MTNPCERCEIPRKPVLPQGSKTARIYIVGLCPTSDEISQKKLFTSESNQILRTALREAEIDINSEVIFSNLVLCKPVTLDGSNRMPEDDEINRCKEFVFNSIQKVNPEIIIVVGKIAASAFIDVSQYKSVTAMTKEEFSFSGIRLKVIQHPNFIKNSGGVGSIRYKEYVQELKKYSNKITYKHELLTLNIMSPEEFLNWSPPSDHMGFDIEATSLDSIGQDFRISGLGFSDVEGNGTYVYLKNENEFNKIAEKLKTIILNNTLYVFNFTFEGTALATKLQIHPYQWKVIDTRQTSMVMGKKGTLKSIAHSMGFPDWETDNEWIINILDKAYKLVYTKTGKKEKSTLLKLRESWSEFMEFLSSNPTHEELYHLLKQIEPRYNELSVITIEDIRQNFINEASKKVYRMFFDLVPIDIVSKYCVYDAFAAIKLHNVLWNTMDDVEKSGCQYLNEHAQLGAAINCTGIGWNVNQAIELDEFYQDEILKSMKNILNNTLFQEALELKTHDLIEINSSTDIEKIKKIFNPNSNHISTRTIFNKVLNQPFAKKVYALYTLYTELSLTPEKDFLDVKDQFIHLLREDRDPEKMKIIRQEKRKFIDSDDSKISQIINLYRDKQNNFLGQKFLDMLTYFNLEHMDEPTIIFLYDAFTKIGGIDIDDISTWTTEFEALYSFRTFKKVYKAYSTYLWGSIGMGEDARLIKKEQVLHVSPPRLVTDWESIIKKQKTLNGHIALATWNHNVNGADTNRWRSRYHLWPWQCELQDLKTSRYERGLIAHVDYSQMEVRTIAALAGESMLLEAYKQGKDIHKFMASKIFDKPEDEIIDTERRYSKMLTFSLLYGKTEKGIAADFLGGDIRKAKSLINGFYDGFPKIAEFVQSQHQLVETGEDYIISIFGDRIPLRIGKAKTNEKDFENKFSEIGQLKRYSVNYPVQSSASHLAGLGISRVYKEAFERNLPLRVFGFTHDAGDFDFDAFYLFDVIDILHRRMEYDILEEFNIPVKIDMEIGVTGDNMMEFHIREKTPEKLVIKAEGSIKALKDIKSRFEQSKIHYELLESDIKEEFVSRQFLFMAKRAFSKKLGKFQKKVNVTLEIFNPNF